MIEHQGKGYWRRGEELNIAQYEANDIGRQEVTPEWYFAHPHLNLYCWIGDEPAKMHLDPWRLNPDADLAIERGWRFFVSKEEAGLK